MPFSFPAGSGTSKRSHTFSYSSAQECGCCCESRFGFPFGYRSNLPWYRHHAKFVFRGEVEDYDTLGIHSGTFDRVTGAAFIGNSTLAYGEPWLGVHVDPEPLSTIDNFPYNLRVPPQNDEGIIAATASQYTELRFSNGIATQIHYARRVPVPSLAGIYYCDVGTGGLNRDCMGSCGSLPITQKLIQHVRSVDGEYDFEEVLYPVSETPWTFLLKNPKAFSWSRYPNQFRRLNGEGLGYNIETGAPANGQVFLHHKVRDPWNDYYVAREQTLLTDGIVGWHEPNAQEVGIQVTMDNQLANWGSAVYGPWHTLSQGPNQFPFGVTVPAGEGWDNPEPPVQNEVLSLIDVGPHIWYVNQGYRDPEGTAPPQATRLIGVNRRIQCDPLLWYYRDYLWLGDKYRLCEIEITLGANDYVWTYPSGTTRLNTYISLGEYYYRWSDTTQRTLHHPGDLDSTRLQEMAVNPGAWYFSNPTPSSFDGLTGAYVPFFSWTPSAGGMIYRDAVPYSQFIQSESSTEGGFNYDPFTFSGGTQGPGGPYTIGYFVKTFTTPVWEFRNLTTGTTFRRGGHTADYTNRLNLVGGDPTFYYLGGPLIWTNGPYGDSYSNSAVTLSNGEWEIEVVEPPKYSRWTVDMTVGPFDVVTATYPRSFDNWVEETDVPLGNLKYHPYKFHAVGVEHNYVWKFVAGTGMADVLNATLTAPD